MSTHISTGSPAAARPVALIVHEASVPYVRPVIEFVRRQLTQCAGRDPLYEECQDVGAVPVPEGSVVFLIGEAFPRFVRQPGCRYVFINFSLVRKLRWWKPIPLEAARWMRAKRCALIEKGDLYDMVLDFHPRQASLLGKELPRVRVRCFMTGVWKQKADANAPVLHARRWDVCFVGTDSPRRARMRELIESRGITVSPSTTPDLGEVMNHSRLVANVHFADCDTLEAPRIVQALAAGTCLVTEPCYGLTDIVPSSCYVSVRYDRMPATIERLLRDTARIDAIARSAAEHARTRYAALASASWRSLVREALEL